MKSNIKQVKNSKNTTTDYKFRNLKSFYLYLINTQGELSQEFYKSVFQSFKGKLKPKYKVVRLNRNNKLLDYVSRHNVLFIKSGIVKSRNLTMANIGFKQYFKSKDLTETENEFLYNSFVDFIKQNGIKQRFVLKSKKEGFVIKDNILKNLVEDFKEIIIKNNFGSKSKIYAELKRVFDLDYINSFLNFGNLEFLNMFDEVTETQQIAKQTNLFYDENNIKSLVYLTDSDYTKKLNAMRNIWEWNEQLFLRNGK